MANSATKLTALNLQNAGSFFGHPAIPVLINYDTPGNDLIISTPVDTQRVFLTGWELVAGQAYNFTLKSGALTLNTFQFGGNSGQGEAFQPGNPGIIVNTEPGQPLIINSDLQLPKFTMYIVEFAA